MLAEGQAYHCYASPQELDEMRAAQKAAGKPMRYDGRWRDRDPKEAPAGVKPVVRLKAPQTGETVIKDAVQGEVTVENAQLDDMILLRADGTPTYMLAVVVDDHDMGVTHVIRGDDHLNNAFRQLQIIRAMGWPEPVYAHIPLIHGPDGAKLSKRHGALGVDAYRDMGFLPAALRNYLLRLGWGHGDDEIISTDAGDRMVRPRRRRPLGLALRHGQAHQPQRALSARDAGCRAAAAGAAAHRGEDRRQGRRRRPRAHRARPERREAARAHADRTRRQSCLLRPRRRAADRRRQGARAC